MSVREPSVDERLERLERKCRNLRLWCIGATSALLVACTAAALAPASDVIRARRFEAIDGDGRTQAELSGDFGEDDVVRGGAGLSIGGHGVGEEDPGVFVCLAVGPDAGRAPSPSHGRDSAVLWLGSVDDESSASFHAIAAGSAASFRVENEFRRIGARIGPGESELTLSTAQEDSEPPAPPAVASEQNIQTAPPVKVRVNGEEWEVPAPPRAPEPETHPRISLRVRGQEATVQGLSPAGESSFRLP